MELIQIFCANDLIGRRKVLSRSGTQHFCSVPIMAKIKISIQLMNELRRVTRGVYGSVSKRLMVGSRVVHLRIAF